ncbi:MAG: thermonuclease family protein [Parvibaculum sp.]|uniref:thermonuclease family protein n=1 Tax=Parvibaculum sp. TaxID=2024848 RepID=UPI003299BCF3
MKKLIALMVCFSTPVLADSIPDCGLYLYAAKVTRIIDGDTIVADIDLGFDVWRHDERLRLAGVQTPEKNEPGFSESSNALADRIAGRSVYICTVKAKRSDNEVRGGFGRYLATIHYEGVNINDWLLLQGYAIPYED